MNGSHYESSWSHCETSQNERIALTFLSLQVGTSLHIFWQVGNSLHIYWQVDNSTYVGCFIFWVPNTSVDSITYGGVMLTVRKPEPSYFSERGTQRPARHPRMPATRVLDHPPNPTVPTLLAPSDKGFLGKPLAPWTTPKRPDLGSLR